MADIDPRSVTRCNAPHPVHVDPFVLCDLDKGHEFNHDGPAPFIGEGVRASWYDDDDVRMPHQGIDPIAKMPAHVHGDGTMSPGVCLECDRLYPNERVRIPVAKPPERESRSARIMAALDALAKAQHELTMAILDVPR